MKNIALTLATILITATFALGQSTLKGPNAKNAKAWKQTKKATAIVKHNVTKSDFTGPKAKNFKPQNHDREVLMVATVQSNAHRKQGPAAKNHKPWDNRPSKINDSRFTSTDSLQIQEK